MTEQEEFEFRARAERERASQPAAQSKITEETMFPVPQVRGALRGFAGGLGELEKFGAYELPQMLGFKGQKPPAEGRATLFPTKEEVGRGMEKIGIPQPARPTTGEKAGEFVGEFLSTGAKPVVDIARYGMRKAQPFVDLLRGRTTAAEQAKLGTEAARAGTAAETAISEQAAKEQAALAQQAKRRSDIERLSAERRAAAETAGAKAERRGESALRGLTGVRTLPEAGAFKPIPQTADEVGQFIRNQSENFVTGIKNRRSELSAKNFASTLDEAKQLENVGQFVQNTEKFGELVKYLDGRLQVVTDPAIRTQLETIKTALTKGAPARLSEGERRVIALREGKTLDQVPEQTFLKPTFEGVEIMRRRIGDAAFGVPEEGYKAIGQGMAKEIYGKLSDAMKDYSKRFTKYLEDYKRLSQPIEVYGTKIGKGLTETVDAGGKYYAKTAEQVAKDIFSNPEKIKQFVDAVGGNKQIVDAAARRYFAGLAEKAKTPEAVQKLLADNRAVLREFPGVADEITTRYLAPLRAAGKRTEAAKDIVAQTVELDKQIAARLKNIKGSDKLISDAVESLSSAKPGKAIEAFERSLAKIREAEANAGTRILTDQQIAALRQQAIALENIADKTEKARRYTYAIAGILGLGAGYEKLRHAGGF